MKSSRDRSDSGPVSPLPVEYQVALPTLGVRPAALLTPNDTITPGGGSRGLHEGVRVLVSKLGECGGGVLYVCVGGGLCYHRQQKR